MAKTKIELEKVINFYIGSDCIYPFDTNMLFTGKIIGCCKQKRLGISILIEHYVTREDVQDEISIPLSDVTLLLRPLSTITDEEQNELAATKVYKSASLIHQHGVNVWTAASYLWACKKGFDLFSLIENGFAKDVTTFDFKTI